ncbi:MAG: phage terminase large subunit [Pseudomonas sp.]
MTPVAAGSIEQVAETCRGSLGAFGAWVHGLQPAKHHVGWLWDLRELAENGGKLLLNAPPGWAKSTWLMIFVEWLLGNHPDWSILFLTSNDSMASKFNIAIRSMMESERYAAVFPDAACRADKDRGWSGDGLWLKGTPMGSKDPAFRAAGFGSSVIGGRVHMVVMDDPQTQEQAQSEVEQPKAAMYHDGTVIARLHPDKPREVFITTRWAESDLAGHCLKQDGWLRRNVPALESCADGEVSTWPERFTTEYVLAMRKLLGTALFRAIWQGDPTSMGGSVFREEKWLRPLPTDFDRRPAFGAKTKREQLNVVTTFDFAFSSRQTADYTGCLTVGQDADMNLYILGAWRGRVDEGDLLNPMVEQWEVHQPHAIGVEHGIWDKYQVVKELIRRARKQIPCVIWPVPAKGDKVARAQLAAGRAEQGMLFMDMEAPWAHDLKAELLAFPLGAHDDWVDALSLAAELLATKLSFLYDIRRLPKQKYSLGKVKARPASVFRPPYTKTA